MRINRVLLVLVILLGLFAAGQKTSIAQADGAELAEAVAAEAAGEEAYVVLDDVEGFPAGGGEAVFEAGSPYEESFTYASADAESSRLVGLTRPSPLAHSAGVFVSSPEPEAAAEEPVEEPASEEPAEDAEPAAEPSGDASSGESTSSGAPAAAESTGIEGVAAADVCGDLCATGEAELETAANLADDLIDEMLLNALIAGILVPDTSACGTADVCAVSLGAQFYDCGSGWKAVVGCKYQKFKIVGGCDNSQCESVTIDLRWRGGTASAYPCAEPSPSGSDEWKERDMKLVRTSDKNVRWRFGEGTKKMNTCVDDYQNSSPTMTITTDHLAIFKWRHIDSGKVDGSACSGCSFNSTARILIAVR